MHFTHVGSAILECSTSRTWSGLSGLFMLELPQNRPEVLEWLVSLILRNLLCVGFFFYVICSFSEYKDPEAMSGAPSYHCPPGTPIEPIPIRAVAALASDSLHRGSPEEGFAVPTSPIARAPVKSAPTLATSPKLFSAKATIQSHETRSEDKRFTVNFL